MALLKVVGSGRIAIRRSIEANRPLTAGVITGWLILGAGAEELISIIALAVKQKLTLQQMSREIFFHPSVSEAVHCACQDALGKCVDLPGKK